MSSASAISSTSAHATPRPRVPETVRIVNWPLREGGLYVWLKGLAIVGFGLAAGVVSGSATMGAVCFAALLFSSWRFWLPVTFELGTKGVAQSTLVFHWRIPWRCFARYETRPRGVWLLTDAEPSPFSTLRGVYVGWSDQEEQMLAVLEFFLAGGRRRATISTRTFVR